ncbi:very short patch repair endonuclease [Bordetella bronchialis]|uniref:very short patch repair endonuclease n=1 Tax=Bordetella bronchialis TaxID=463025 RepID=UPI0009F272C5|nr:very short patch repair endonuclease [Bordetella bronchialis]
MVDTLTPEQRSERMARVRGRDTKPELVVRKTLHALGFRYRLHDARLPGKPDLVFKGRRKAVFVHGCFWHMHCACALSRMPKSNLNFWRPKLEGNRARDALKLEQLHALGWNVLVVWECELRDMKKLVTRLEAFLNDDAGESK